MSETDIVFAGLGGIGLILLLWSSASWSAPATRNIYDQQRSNRRWSYFLMGVFALFVGFLGFGADVFLLRMPVPWLGLNVTNPFPFGSPMYWDWIRVSGEQQMGMPWVTAGSVVGSYLWAQFSFQNAPRAVLAATRARMPNLQDAKEVQFVNVVREMATAAGLPAPSCWIVPDPDLNAFATGTEPHKAHVAITEGLLQALNREELQGVMAHELSHVRNADMELMTMVVALMGAAALVSDGTQRVMYSSRGASSSGSSTSGGGKKGGWVFGIWLLAILLAPILSRLMAMAVSRRREYLADASGAELTRNPLSLAKALEKIHAAVDATQSLRHDSMAHLCIDDPRGGAWNAREGFLGDLFASHPPIQQRILALKEMAYLYAPEIQG